MADFKSEVAPHACVTCGKPAYVPFGDMECKCTSRACFMFDAALGQELLDERREQSSATDKALEEYVKEHAPDFADEDTEPETGTALRAQMDLDASFDWRKYIVRNMPISTNGNEMTFQMPKRKARSVCIGDRLGPPPNYRVCKIDRVRDQITMFPEKAADPIGFAMTGYYGLKMGGRREGKSLAQPEAQLLSSLQYFLAPIGAVYSRLHGVDRITFTLFSELTKAKVAYDIDMYALQSEPDLTNLAKAIARGMVNEMLFKRPK